MEQTAAQDAVAKGLASGHELATVWLSSWPIRCYHYSKGEWRRPVKASEWPKGEWRSFRVLPKEPWSSML